LVVNCYFYPNNGIATVYTPDYPGGSEIFDQAVLSAPSPNNGYPNTPLNSGAGNGFSDNNGNSQFTFTGQGGAGTDTIQASTGPLTSNTVQVTWQSAKCPATKDSGKTI
jgi:hypothetical protein